MPPIAGIHRPYRRARIDADEKNRVKMEVKVMIDKKIMTRKIRFSHATTMPLTKRIPMRSMKLFLIWIGSCNR